MPSYIYYTITDVWDDLTTFSLEFPEGTDPADLVLLVQAFADLIAPLVGGGLAQAGCQWPVSVSGWSMTAASGADIQEKAEFNLTTVTGFRKLISLPTFHEAYMRPGRKEVDLTDIDVAAFITALESGVDLTGAGGSGVVEPCDTRGDDLDHVAAAIEAWGKRRERVRDLSLYYEIVRSTAWSSLLGYWRLNELSGAVAEDWSFHDVPGDVQGLTWGADGIGDGSTAAAFDGVNDWIDLSNTDLPTRFDPELGSLLIWFRVPAGAWVDGLRHVMFSIYQNTDNRIWLQVGPGENTFNAFYTAGGVYRDTFKTMSSLDWQCFVLTWDKAADEVKFFVNGTQNGSTLTGLGVWDDTPTSITMGGFLQYYQWWGWLAHVALWDCVLTPAEIAELAEVE